MNLFLVLLSDGVTLPRGGDEFTFDTRGCVKGGEYDSSIHEFASGSHYSSHGLLANIRWCLNLEKKLFMRKYPEWREDWTI